MLYRLAAASAAFIAAAGCGDGPTTPSTPTVGLQLAEAQAAAKRAGVSSNALVKRTFRVTNKISATAEVTPEGGFLWMPEAGLAMYFPAGAVSRTIEVSATAIEGNRIVYDFQPHGTVFNTPIHVAQSILQTELENGGGSKKRQVWAGYLANGSSDIAADGRAFFSETFDALYIGTGTGAFVVFTTTHFSGYALASGLKPNVPSIE